MTRGLAAAVAVAASIGAGLVHLALGPDHLEELGALGWGFYLAAVLQVGSAFALLAARSDRARRRVTVATRRRVAVATIGINLAILGAWIVSRTVGLPAGETPWVPESIGSVDVITALLEVAIVAALVAELEHPLPAPAQRPSLAMAIAVLVIAAGTAVALSPVAAHDDGDHGTHAEQHGGTHAERHEAMTGAESAP